MIRRKEIRRQKEDKHIKSKEEEDNHIQNAATNGAADRTALSFHGRSFFGGMILCMGLALISGPAWNNRDENGKTIFYLNIDYQQVWQELEKAVDQGLLRTIRVGNFNSQTY
ncbi:hypothetical protein QYM36_009624 [Artemia franciscana]|uniref:Uncharacterized protein n=1 Tax=Artemia franciscana TaxID=6661 RepID=A0AA88HKY3_ARTSF|nr:hypothetical protein QYM36_009624 [Artemia franciscana]